MNWLQFLMRGLSLVPVIVAGIEQIHQGAPGSTKKELAMQALALATTGISSAVTPEQKYVIDAASQLVSSTIDGVVSTMNAAGVFQKVQKAQPAQGVQAVGAVKNN